MSDQPGKTVSTSPEKKQRYDYIDQFRGLIIILMLVDHCSYYLNSVWLYYDPLDPLFSSWGQVALRYVGYLCAPGFLIISGAMIWLSYHRRIEQGVPARTIRWQIIQRGLFLVFLQMTWVNSSWGGFREFTPWHLGIIACIGISMIFLAFIVHLRWQWQLLIGLAILFVHPYLLKISYNHDTGWEQVIMQTFVDAGEFNKYPVLPWFASAVLGSVMATGWLRLWKTDKKRIFMSIGIAAIAMMLAVLIRFGRGYGNIFPFSEFGTYSFFFDQKYPPSLFFSLWFFGLVVVAVAGFIAISKVAPKLLTVFSIPGKVALFFYLMHIAIMGVFVKRLDFFYHEGEVLASLVGVAVMLVVMIPLCHWFYAVKSRSTNYFIRML